MFCWFICQLITTGTHLKFHSLTKIPCFFFFNQNLFSTNTKKTKTYLLAINLWDVCRGEKCSFISLSAFVLSGHSTSSLPLPVSGAATSASASFSGSWSSEGSGWVVSISSSTGSGWGDDVSSSSLVVSSSWRETTISFQGKTFLVPCFMLQSHVLRQTHDTFWTVLDKQKTVWWMGWTVK